MNRIERYLGKVVVNYTLLVLLILVALLSFFEAIYQFGKVNESYTFSKAMIFVVLKTPGYIYEMFPIALLIGTLMGLGNLANHGELTILRVTGWSIRRILLSVAKSAFLLWLVTVFVGEYIAPKSESYAQKVRVEAMNKSLSLGSSQGFWVKDSGRYIHIGKVISANELHDVSIYQLGSGHLERLETSSKVLFDPKYGWLLQDGRGLDLHFNSLPPSLSAQVRADYPSLNADLYSQLQLSSYPLLGSVLAMPLSPDDLTKLDMDSRYLSLLDLYAYIQFLQQNELDSSAYQLDYWRKIAMPLVAFAMLAVVFPLIFGSQRQVSMGQRVFIGIVIGLGFQLVNLLIGNLTLVYHLPISLGTILPAALLTIFSLLWMRRLP